jgi:hypothetical protein
LTSSLRAYVFHRERQALELLTPGDFRDTAGLLGLQQALPPTPV